MKPVSDHQIRKCRYSTPLIDALINDDDFIVIHKDDFVKIKHPAGDYYEQTGALVIFNDTFFSINATPLIPFGDVHTPYHCVTATPYVIKPKPSYIIQEIATLIQADYGKGIVRSEHMAYGLTFEEIVAIDMALFKEKAYPYRSPHIQKGGLLRVPYDAIPEAWRNITR